MNIRQKQEQTELRLLSRMRHEVWIQKEEESRKWNARYGPVFKETETGSCIARLFAV